MIMLYVIDEYVICLLVVSSVIMLYVVDVHAIC